MSLFVWDTAGNQDLLNTEEAKPVKSKYPFSGNGPLAPKPCIEEFVDPGSEEEDDGDYGGLPPPSHDISHILVKSIAKTKPTRFEKGLELAVQMVESAQEAKAKNKPTDFRYTKRANKDIVFPHLDLSTGKFVDEISAPLDMEIPNNEGLELKKGLPQLRDKTLRDLRRIERGKNKGEGWFNMPATEVTEEVENDLKILQMRSVLNPKHFYKKNDLKVLPKYFQVGTVMHSPLDFYKERDTRRNKKKTLVDELMADAEFQKYTKRKFKEVTARNDRYAHKKAMKKMKKLKKNK